jgi:hypothetical protein
VIEDENVSGAAAVTWDAGAEAKPLLTRAEPLDSRAPAAIWMLRLAAFVLLVAIVAALLLASGVL